MLADIVNVLNLEMFVIGGGVASAWNAFAPKMFEELRARSTIYNATTPKDAPTDGSVPGSRGGKQTLIARAQLGSDAGLFGGARLPQLA
jgi:glucokinase